MVRWTLPIEHLAIATSFIVVGLFVNFLQFLVFVVFWPINKDVYRRVQNKIGVVVVSLAESVWRSVVLRKGSSGHFLRGNFVLFFS